MNGRTEVPAEFLNQPAGEGSDSDRNTRGSADVWATRPRSHATQKQVAFVASLVSQKDLPPEAAKSFAERIAAAEAGDWANGIGFNKASEFIARLKALPNRVNRTEPGLDSRFTFAKKEAARKFMTWPSVPDGRYAIRVSGDDLNPIHFFTVRTSEHDDEWKGFQGLKRHSSDERFKVTGAKRREIMELIAADPEASAILYGHETNHCGICGRELTRDESRERGIGPVCAEKSGWGN